MIEDREKRGEQSEEIGTTSLVSFALGVPIGVSTGDGSGPTVKLAQQLVEHWVDRRKQRITDALKKAFSQANMSDDAILIKLSNDEGLADDIILLIRKLIDTDPQMDYLFASIISSMISEPNGQERKRLLVLSEAIKGINYIQMQIIKLIADYEGTLSAKEIAIGIGIPEIELRNSVRDLELRGIITDNNTEPTVWELRELGKALYSILSELEEQYGY